MQSSRTSLWVASNSSSNPQQSRSPRPPPSQPPPPNNRWQQVAPFRQFFSVPDSRNVPPPTKAFRAAYLRHNQAASHSPTLCRSITPALQIQRLPATPFLPVLPLQI